MPNLKKVAILSLAVLIAQVILTKLIYPAFNLTTQTVYSISPVTGIGGTQIGNTVLGYLSGLIPFELGNIAVWIAIYLGAFALFYAGFFIYENKKFKVWQGNNLTQRLIAILLYGHIVLYLFLLLLKQDVPGIALNLAIGLFINLVALSILVSSSARYLKWPRV